MASITNCATTNIIVGKANPRRLQNAGALTAIVRARPCVLAGVAPTSMLATHVLKQPKVVPFIWSKGLARRVWHLESCPLALRAEHG